MSVPFLCVLAALILTLATKLPVAVAMARQRGGYDNRHPRDQQAALTGWGRRAVSAHQNAFEAFAPFAAAVLIADAAGGDPLWSARLAVSFLVLRLAYTALYLADLATLRSLAWSAGFAATVALMALPLWK